MGGRKNSGAIRSTRGEQVSSLSSDRRKNAVKRLEDLRQEINALRSLPPLSARFVDWLVRLDTLVGELFGTSSTELAELRSIIPELPTEFYNKMEGITRSQVFDASMAATIDKLIKEAAPRVFFEKQLDRYAEFVGAMIYEVQRVG